MNIPRFVLLASTAVAVVAAILFGANVAGSRGVRVDSGAIACAPTSQQKDLVFGIRVENRGDRPVTLDSIEPRTRTGVGMVRAWALPPIALEGGPVEPGTATIPDVAGWSGRRAVEGAALPAHRTVVIVVNPRLVAGATSGTARDFVLRFTPQGSVQRTEVSGWVVGYRPTCS